jgi:hypothetical protein
MAVTACSHDGTSAVVTDDFALRSDMRELWIAHGTWTRVVIIDMAAHLPDTDAATQRLLQNQVDIGNAMRPFYGDAAADHLTSLLHDHITLAAALIVAAQGGDAGNIATARTAWYANADEIANFLADANPHWGRADLIGMMHTHLDQTLAEATARLTGDWNADVAAYDAVSAHMNEMADAFAVGITQQFPDRVSHSAMPAGEQQLRVAMRSLWQDHVSWTRFYLVEQIAGLPSVPTTTARLLRNQDDIGAAIATYYGAGAGAQLTSLLHDHITGAAAVVVAAQAGDDAALQTASAAWYANADAIAAFLAGANPNWSQAELRDMMHMHLDGTTTEATARIHADWAGDVRAYDAVVTHILHMSDALSAGIAAQFPGTAPQ